MNNKQIISKSNQYSSLITKNLENKQKNINKIISVLNLGKISSEDYDSTVQPFFMGNKDNIFKIDYKSIRDTPSRLNRNIILIYNILGNPKKEIYLGEWTIMSLEKAKDRYKKMCEDGQFNVFDIGYKYEGMGHITVISCDLETHLLFYRPDGGSNGYDRMDNYNNVIKKSTSEYDKFYFSQWFYSINIVDDMKWDKK